MISSQLDCDHRMHAMNLLLDPACDVQRLTHDRPHLHASYHSTSRVLPQTMTLKYVPDALPNEVEMGVIILGPLTVIAAFVAACGLSFLSQRTLGSFPEVPSRFISFLGVAAVLDSPLIAIVDAAAGRYDCTARFPACAADIASWNCRCSEGDAWRLYTRFQREEGSGVIGIVITLLIYAVLALTAALLLYLFSLHLHLNGRMIDTYRRLHGAEDRFAVPGDHEVSPAELKAIISRTHRWRGPKGTLRKVAVCDYVVTDPLEPGWKETTSHLIIYNTGLDGGRELYRHFLRLPDGTIVEVFGSLDRYLGLAGAAATPALQQVLLNNSKDVKAAAGTASGTDFFPEI